MKTFRRQTTLLLFAFHFLACSRSSNDDDDAIPIDCNAKFEEMEIALEVANTCDRTDECAVVARPYGCDGVYYNKEREVETLKVLNEYYALCPPAGIPDCVAQVPSHMECSFNKCLAIPD